MYVKRAPTWSPTATLLLVSSVFLLLLLLTPSADALTKYTNSMKLGDSLSVNDALSMNPDLELILQSDGNLVLYVQEMPPPSSPNQQPPQPTGSNTPQRPTSSSQPTRYSTFATNTAGPAKIVKVSFEDGFLKLYDAKNVQQFKAQEWGNAAAKRLVFQDCSLSFLDANGKEVQRLGTGCKCTNVHHCSNHALTVEKTSEGCKCQCSNGWAGNKCEKCSEGVTGKNCDECFTARVNYPACTLCTVKDQCSSNGTASAALTADLKSCECKCKAGWSGAKCDQIDLAPQCKAKCDAVGCRSNKFVANACDCFDCLTDMMNQNNNEKNKVKPFGRVANGEVVPCSSSATRPVTSCQSDNTCLVAASGRFAAVPCKMCVTAESCFY